LEVFLNYPDIDEYTAETFQLLGNLFRDRGEVDRALKVHQNVIARSNLNAQQTQKAMYALGKDFFAAGMLDRAESVFQELLDNKSNKWVSKALICSSLRTIYEQTQEWEKAIEATSCIKRNQKKNEENTQINSQALISHYYCELADEALGQGKLHEVDGYISAAKKSYKNSTRLMTLLGDMAFHQKHYKQALQHYLNAVKHDSRLLSMLFEKLEESSSSAGEITKLQKELFILYKKNRDRTVFETIISMAKKYGSSSDLDELIDTELSSKKLNIESIYKVTEYIQTDSSGIDCGNGLRLVNKSLENYLQGVPAFRCEHCGYRMHDYLWRCPACHHWDSIDHA
jgi:lipopolysaccharide biosynthesis regulator YciM